MKDCNQIRVAGIDYRGSICDGPGIRTVLFLQGCTRHCQGCHNKETWDVCGGHVREIDSLVEEIARCSPYDKVTISGGEPLLQPEALEVLVEGLDNAGFELALYTSFSRDDVPSEVKNRLKYLKTGPYIKDMRSTVVPYVGSSNQCFERL